MLIKKADVMVLLTNAILNKKIENKSWRSWRVENKISDTSGLVTTTVLNTKSREGENNIPDVSGLVKNRS